MTRIAFAFVRVAADQSRAGAVARPRRAGARARDLGRRRDRRLRQLRYLRDPLVADPQRRRAGAALPRKRGERGRARCPTAASSPAARTAGSRSGSRARRRPTRCSRATPRRSSASRCRPTARRSPRRRGTAPSGCGRSSGGEPRVLEGHQQNVNGVAFTPDGKALVSAAYDLTLRIWPLDGGAPTIVTLPTPLNSVAVAPRRRDRRRRRRRPGVLLLAVRRAARRDRQRPDADHRRRGVARRRAGGRRRHPRLGRDHRPRRRARSRARWSVRACRCGRRRSCRTTARCSPAAPTA